MDKNYKASDEQKLHFTTTVLYDQMSDVMTPTTLPDWPTNYLESVLKDHLSLTTTITLIFN